MSSFTLMSFTQQQHRMPHQINKLAQAFVKSKSNHGVVIGVIHQDHQVIKGYGTISLENEQSPDKHSIFDLGAISEVFTTAIMMHENNAGKFDIAQRVLDYLPAGVTIPSFDPLACKYVNEPDENNAIIDRIFLCENSPFTPDKCITFCDLATHSSGLKNVPAGLYSWNPFKYVNQRKDPFKTTTKEDVYKSLEYYQLNYEPGKIYSHSSWGIAVLGHLIADINQVTYPHLIKQLILDPLHMNSTFVKIPEKLQINYLPGHNRKGAIVEPMHFNGMAPALGLKSSAHDLIIFLAAQLNMHLEPIALRDAFTETHDPKLDTKKHHLGRNISLGYGWFNSPLNNSNDLPVVWIHGGTNGFNAFIGFIKATQTGVIILTNSQNPTEKMGFNILEILNPQANFYY